jgi:predicted dinucleotide-binding enzyme
MKIAVLGTGMVGTAIATKLVTSGHHIMMGSRTANNDAGQEWLRSVGGKAQCGTFAEAAAFGEIVFNCTNGTNALVALRQAVAANLRGKILIEVANPLDMSTGTPPSLTVCNTDSLGEQVQREFPNTRVVKALNTMNCEVMVQPSLVSDDHNVFLCGNDAEAKREVIDRLCEWFGWKKENIIDLGDISAARGMEMFLPLWLRLWSALGTGHFNIRVVRGN